MPARTVSRSGPKCTNDDLVFKGSETPGLRDINIGQLIEEWATSHAGRIAIKSTWQSRKLTYSELYHAARKIATKLLYYGVRPGDHVVVLCGNSIEFIELFLAIGGIGSVVAIINPLFMVQEMVEAIEFLEPKAAFITNSIGYRNNSGLLDKLSQSSIPLLVELGGAHESHHGITRWDDFLKTGTKDVEAELLTSFWATSDPAGVLSIQFTSGTTGSRKAAQGSHSGLLNGSLLTGARLEYTPEDAVCCCAPLFHCFGLVCGMLAPLIYGASIIMSSEIFLASETLQALTDERCTILHAVPTMLQALLDHEDAAAYLPRTSLRNGIIGGASLPTSLMKQLASEPAFKGLSSGYGSTELHTIAFSTLPRENTRSDKFLLIGTLMPHLRAKIVDGNMQALPVGGAGELLIRGFAPFPGYYKEPAKTEEATVIDEHGNQWLRTGDIAVMDDNYCCKIIGRVKDTIKRGGEQIFAVDIEHALEQHPDIEEAAVVGVPDEYWGEVIAAFIQPSKGLGSTQNLTKKALKLWLRKKLAPYKMPEHVFVVGQEGILDALPKNAQGKVLKRELKALAEKLSLER